MAMMEQAAGISALFEADGKMLIGHEKRLELHTQLMTDSAAVISLINEREQADDNANA
jgi:hypothetical protein